MRLNGVRDKTVSMSTVDADRMDLTGRKIAVVGGTNGLGRAIARLAASRGAKADVVGRTFRDDGSQGIGFVRADLTSMREAAEIGRTLPVEDADVLLFTTGIFAAKTREETAEHVERDMAVSYLSRHAMLRGLAARLGADRPADAPRPRVFVMAAPGTGTLGNPADLNADAATYKALTAHMNTVAANEALVLAAPERLPGPAYFGLNPGMVRTDIRSNFLGDGSFLHRAAESLIGVLGPTPEQYARRVLPLLFHPDLDGRDRVFFNPKAVPIQASPGMAGARAAEFFDAGEDLLRRALA
ncbi:hypothetical protein, partial [Kutzneria sp. 744]|uniref:hypothetical protein n=1 Tax=Kutzneria sp. (strain 744) TaxID=345341 RepID=UPI0003EEE0AA